MKLNAIFTSRLTARTAIIMLKLIITVFMERRLVRIGDLLVVSLFQSGTVKWQEHWTVSLKALHYTARLRPFEIYGICTYNLSSRPWISRPDSKNFVCMLVIKLKEIQVVFTVVFPLVIFFLIFRYFCLIFICLFLFCSVSIFDHIILLIPDPIRCFIISLYCQQTGMWQSTYDGEIGDLEQSTAIFVLHTLSLERYRADAVPKGTHNCFGTCTSGRRLS